VTINGKDCFITAMIDVSKRKQFEEELNKSNELFLNLFELNPASLSISRLKTASCLRLTHHFYAYLALSAKKRSLAKQPRKSISGMILKKELTCFVA
jgi:hypothetical protein